MKRTDLGMRKTEIGLAGIRAKCLSAVKGVGSSDLKSEI